MRTSILSLSLLLIAVSCINRNPQIDKVWNVKYPEYKTNAFNQPFQLRKNDPLKKLETGSEYFTFYSDDTTITGKNGTIVSISRACLSSEDWDVVEGPIKIELREIFSKSDLIFNNKPTVSDNKMLVSAGAIYINASSEGKNLRINCPDGIHISIPRQSSYPGMQVFNGELNEDGDINWVTETKQAEETEYFYDETNEEYIPGDIIEFAEGDSWEDPYFSFYPSGFGWINCDAFYEDTRPRTNLIVKISNPLPEDFKSRMFLVFKSLNSVLQIYPKGPDLFESPEIPEGEEVYLVCISGNERALFSEIKTLTLKAHQMETIALTETREDILKEKINTLNR